MEASRSAPLPSPRPRHVPGLELVRGGGALPAASYIHSAPAATHPSPQRAASRRPANAAAQLPAAGPRARRRRSAAAARRYLGVPEPAGAAPGAAAAAPADASETATVRAAGAAAGAAPSGAAAAAAAWLLHRLAAAAATCAAAGSQLPKAVRPPRAAAAKPQAARCRPGARRTGAAGRARRLGRAGSLLAGAHGHGAVLATAVPAALLPGLPTPRSGLPAASPSRAVPTPGTVPAAPALPAPSAGLSAALLLLRAPDLLPGAPTGHGLPALPAASCPGLHGAPPTLSALLPGLPFPASAARSGSLCTSPGQAIAGPFPPTPAVCAPARCCPAGGPPGCLQRGRRH